VIAAAVLLQIAACAHGLTCDVHTMEWDSLTANHYRVKWRTDVTGLWEATTDECFQACDPLPCRLRCDVPILRPPSGEVVFLTVVAVVDGEEGP